MGRVVDWATLAVDELRLFEIGHLFSLKAIHLGFVPRRHRVAKNQFRHSSFWVENIEFDAQRSKTAQGFLPGLCSLRETARRETLRRSINHQSSSSSSSISTPKFL